MMKWFITLGLILVVIGLLWPVLSRLGLGHLPGDIRIQKPGMFFYFPITTSLIIGIVLSLVLWFLRR